MIRVKIIENDGLGKVIVPQYFPISVFKRAFGSLEISKDYIDKLSSVTGYISLNKVNDNHIFTVKELSQEEREGSLSSFYYSVKDMFAEINSFTYENYIEQEDLSLEPGYQKVKYDKVKSKVVKENFDEVQAPVDMYLVGKMKNSKDEELILKKSINYYLEKLGLHSIENLSDYPVHYLSTKGDSLIHVALLDYFDNRKILDLLSSNGSMQLAMGRLGFYEFLEIDKHLAGTFFEVLYACAILQSNSEVAKQLELTLVGVESVKEKLYTIKFKEN